MTAKDEGQKAAGGAELSGPVRRSTFVDTHCHLDLKQFDEDRDAVVERAIEAGVTCIVNPGIHLDSCRRVLALADSYPGVYAGVGVHPNDCAGFDAGLARELRALAQHPKVVAIGEIGLDYYWERVPREEQKRALRQQLALAADLGLPVILHARNPSSGGTACTDDLLWEMEQWGPEIRKERGPDAILGVWHAFSGTYEDAQRACAGGLALGLGGPVTFLNARRLHELAPLLPYDRLLLETDAPYLAPHPHRGKRNESSYVPLIAASLADLLDTDTQAVAARTTETAQRCFKFDARMSLAPGTRGDDAQQPRGP